MTVAPHAPHEPYTPAPWYQNASVPGYNNYYSLLIIHNNVCFCKLDIPYPVLPWYNYSAVGHVPFLAAEPPISHEIRKNSEFAFFERFRSLMAVDDVVAAIFATLEKFDGLNNTCIFSIILTFWFCLLFWF